MSVYFRRGRTVGGWGLAGVVVSLIIGFACLTCLAAVIVVGGIIGDSRGPSLISPDGRFEAYIRERSGGTLGDTYTSVIIVDRRRDWLPEYVRRESVFGGSMGLESVSIEWTDARTLVITYPEAPYFNIYGKDDGWRGVRVEFRPYEYVPPTPQTDTTKHSN